MACLFVTYASLNGDNVKPTLLLSPRVERLVFLLKKCKHGLWPKKLSKLYLAFAMQAAA